MGQAIDPDRVSRPVFVLEDRHEAGEGIWHAHNRAQLIHASEGVLSVRAEAGLWIVPPQRAVWVLAGVPHQVSSRRGFWLHTLYGPARADFLPRTCRVVAVDRLVEELLAAAAGFGLDYPLEGPEARLLSVVLDRLPGLLMAPLYLPRPSSEGLRRLTNAMQADLANPCTLDKLAADYGMTSRTAARNFIKETGLTFGRWRQQLRLLTALERLGEGASVTTVALDVGYSDVSSFIALFRDAFGETPARYFR